MISGKSLLRGLLVFVPVTAYLGLSRASPTWVFIASCLAILPLAGLMGEATEHLTHHTGPGIGGLLNASFGNAAELIIAFMALRAGETEIVKASLTGSIIGNILMVLGIAMGSSMQIALFVAPLLVIAGHWMGVPLGLEFTILEVVAVMLSVAAVALLIQDGRTNWFEGLQLLAIYTILAMAFYFV